MSFFKKVAVIFVICSLIFIATSCGGGIEKQVESQFLKFAEMHTGIKYYADDLETVQVATKTKDGITSQIFEVRGTVLSGEEKIKAEYMAGWNAVKPIIGGIYLS